MLQLISRQKLLKRAIGLLFFFSSLFEARFAFGGEAQEKKKAPRVAARVADEIVTLDEIEKTVASQLAQLEEQRYQLMQSKLEELIAERLLAREAKRRGIAVEELLKAEVLSQVPEVTEVDVTAFIIQNKGRLQGETAELRLKVRAYLGEQKVAQQRSAYVASLERSTRVERFLEEPEPHRVKIGRAHV